MHTHTASYAGWENAGQFVLRGKEKNDLKTVYFTIQGYHSISDVSIIHHIIPTLSIQPYREPNHLALVCQKLYATSFWNEFQEIQF